MADAKPGGSFADCVIDHHELVNNEASHPDVFFYVDDKTPLTAHYYVLKMRLPALLEEGPSASSKKSKKAKGSQKEKKVVIKLNKSDQITHSALEQVLIWVYSGVIDEKEFTPFKAIEVMRACSVYKITRLMQMNEKFLQDALTMKNIFSLLKFADQLNVQEAKDICIEFALLNGDFFTSNNAENLGFKLYQEVTSLLLKFHQSPDKKTLTIKNVTEPDTIVTDFANLFNAADTTGDLVFVIQGEEVKAHRPLLSNLSPKLSQLIGTPETVTGPIKLDTKYQRITPGAFRAMLKFVYYGDEAVGMQHATELVSFAKDYRLNAFYKVLENVVGGQEVSTATVLSVLDVAYHPLMDENPSLQEALKNQGLNFTVANVDKINFEPLMTMPPLIGTHILMALQQRIGGDWSKINSSKSKPISLADLGTPPPVAAESSPVSEETSSKSLKKPESKKDLSTPKKSKPDRETPRSAMSRTKSKHGGSKTDLREDKGKKDEKKEEKKEEKKDERKDKKKK